ncbi:MAG: hypothetical protein FD126_723 [Elusimicrobia bacterium]|nr:MAG: hypothetical protein FD126_723 [Elusimicrobiota bacterium]
MKNIFLAVLAVAVAVPAFAQNKFPIRAQLVNLSGGELPEVPAFQLAEEKAVEPARGINCTMDVDFTIKGKGLLIIKVWGEYRATAKVTCDKGGVASYDIVGEGPSVGLQIPGRNIFQSKVSGQAVGLNFRLPVDGTPRQLAGEYFGGGISTALGGVNLSPFTNSNGQFEVKLSLPTGLKDDQGTLISLDIQRVVMTLKD